MSWSVSYLWLVPVLPLVAAGITALMKQRQRKPAASLAIGSMVLAFLVSCAAFFQTVRGGGGEDVFRERFDFLWIRSRRQ